MNFYFKIKNILKNYFGFIFRQVYRLFIITPFLIVVNIVEFFLKYITKKNSIEKNGVTFIITSVIYPKQKKLSYSSVRSVYNPEERAVQTLKTVESIREKVSNAKIILVESGLQENLPFGLIGKVDSYLYLGNNFFVRHACDSKLKSLGEAVMLLAAFRYIQFDRALFFKISGRYFLDENFNLSSWQTAFFRFFYIRKKYISTRLYSFGSNMKLKWYFALIKGLPLLFLDYPIEHILPRFISKKYIVLADKVGVTGADSTTGQIIKE